MTFFRRYCESALLACCTTGRITAYPAHSHSAVQHRVSTVSHSNHRIHISKYSALLRRPTNRMTYDRRQFGHNTHEIEEINVKITMIDTIQSELLSISLNIHCIDPLVILVLMPPWANLFERAIVQLCHATLHSMYRNQIIDL